MMNSWVPVLVDERKLVMETGQPSNGRLLAQLNTESFTKEENGKGACSEVVCFLASK